MSKVIKVNFRNKTPSKWREYIAYGVKVLLLLIVIMVAGIIFLRGFYL